MDTLRARLEDWQDFDTAAVKLAQNIGLMDKDTDYANRAKHIFWSRNPVGDCLYDFIFRLIDLGILERSPEGSDDDKVRWNPNFKGSWQ